MSDITNFTYFKSEDKCYNPRITPDASLQLFLSDNFTSKVETINSTELSTSTSILNSCEEQAIRANKDFFLISDASVNNQYGTSKLNYTCYLPKTDKNWNFSTLENVVKPFNDILSNLFSDGLANHGQNISKTVDFEKIQNSTINASDISQCFSVKKNDKTYYFAKKGVFSLYKTELVNDEILEQQLQQISRNSRTYDDYERKYKADFVYDNHLTTLQGKFKNFICNPNSNHESDFNIALANLKLKYEQMFTNLDNISTDISTISTLTKYDTLYLERLQKLIDDEKNKFKSLIGFDGGNNGKLADTRFLKNLKLGEIISLSILMLFVIFIYSKKKF